MSRVVAAHLFGVASNDPASFILAAGLLTAALVLAALIPARLAARQDPLGALREA
jgi:ABC-type antimicrobial peptide transport system permease subunit